MIPLVRFPASHGLAAAAPSRSARSKWSCTAVTQTVGMPAE